MLLVRKGMLGHALNLLRADMGSVMFKDLVHTAQKITLLHYKV
jgi:hypothetical protein